jgi:hypothetical protein
MKYIPFFTLLFFVGCTTTKITSSWIAPEAGSTEYRKIMVAAVIENKDTSLGRKMEQHLVDDLHTIGYDAIGFRDLFKEGELKDTRYDTVRKKLIEKGVDGVITIRLMAVEIESAYVKERQFIDEDGAPLGNFWHQPTTIKQTQSKVGYYLTATSYYWQSSFYDVRTIALLYNSQSTAFEVTSMESLAHKYAKMIVKDLQKNYVLYYQRRSAGLTALEQWFAHQLMKASSPLISVTQNISLH